MYNHILFLLQSVLVKFTEKAMAPHSSTFAWKIPWMEEPGRLKSMGSLRVRHDWAASLSLFTFMHGEGNGNPLQYSCLENPRDRGAWWAFGYGVARSRTRLKRLSSSSSSEIYGNIHSHSVLTISPCTGILHSMACHFIVLCRYCIFHKLKFCGSPYRAILLASLSVPFSIFQDLFFGFLKFEFKKSGFSFHLFYVTYPIWCFWNFLNFWFGVCVRFRKLSCK